MDSLQRVLAARLGAQGVSSDDALRDLMSQDIFYRTERVALVVRPGSTADVAEVVRQAALHQAHVVVRGGGMSYSGGYISPDPRRAIVLDMRGMDRIVEVNAQDMYVVVEPGCTWAALDKHLAGQGLRAAYWGTLSGRKATVGGSIAQNAIFWGAGCAGMVADSVLGLEVVAGNGAVLRTGSFGISGANGFNRHFGPDLTGVFTGDSGALGIKTRIVLRLRHRPRLTDGVSCLLPDAPAMIGFMSDVARAGLAAQQMALDDGLKSARMAEGSWRDLASLAWKVMRDAANPLIGARRVGAMALAGRRVMDGSPWSAHVFLEADGDAALAERRDAARALVLKHGGREITPSVPRAMLADPFPKLNGITGPRGERWVPVHCVLPLSRAEAGYAALQAVFANHAVAMAQYGITQSCLCTTIGNHAFVLEPMFFWPDKLEDLHRHTIGPERTARFPENDAAPEARELVARIRAEATEAVDALGAVHFQLGGFYPYRRRLDAGAALLLDALSASLDPQNRVNPGVLRD